MQLVMGNGGLNVFTNLFTGLSAHKRVVLKIIICTCAVEIKLTQFNCYKTFFSCFTFYLIVKTVMRTIDAL